ncbi:MAG: MotA/TolQ/ExbB proton channel family protein [Proteobacteria bacterium]|nr:MotA/TolQ/ExbB proton channel family protein [Pseudomonadota bacterium]MCP4916865.1 MotA/TolQ/ExbB proton channel family protein [Pseudomonadota bacterium]
MMAFALLGAGWVMWLLVGLSVVCIFVAVERAIYLVQNTTPSGGLQAALATYLKSGNGESFRKSLDGMKGIEARVLAAGLEASEKGPDAAEEAIAGTIVFEKDRLERFLIVLGTVGSNAPFIGLFGTVLGIIQAFHDLASMDPEGAGAVMAGISEALVATAIGLMVAIPAVVLYNFFQRMIKGQMRRVESLSHLVLAQLKSRDGDATELVQKGV